MEIKLHHHYHSCIIQPLVRYTEFVRIWLTPRSSYLSVTVTWRFVSARVGLLEGLEEHVEQDGGRDAEAEQDVARQVKGRVVRGGACAKLSSG